MPAPDATTKYCGRCDQYKPVSDFAPRKDRPGKHHAFCRPCASVYRRHRYEHGRPPERVKPLPPKAPGHKWCHRCSRLLTLDQFQQMQRYCRECKSEIARDSRTTKVQAQSRWRTIKRKYGITEADFRAMEQAQGGACAICRTLPEDGLYVDHDHQTGKVRGLLCFQCNSGIGSLRDDIERLQRAIAYLRRHAG